MQRHFPATRRTANPRSRRSAQLDLRTPFLRWALLAEYPHTCSAIRILVCPVALVGVTTNWLFGYLPWVYTLLNINFDGVVEPVSFAAGLARGGVEQSAKFFAQLAHLWGDPVVRLRAVAVGAQVG